MQRQRLTIPLYLSVSFLFWLSLYIYVPTLPTYIKIRAADLSSVGLVLSMYGLMQALIRIPLGIAVDARGRGKPFLLPGIALSAVGALILAGGRSIGHMALGRLLTGVAAAMWVPLLVAFSAYFPPERTITATSLLALVGYVGRVLSSSLNGWLNRWGGYALAFYVAAAAAVMAILILVFTPEKTHSGRPPTLSAFYRLITRRDVFLPALISTVIQFATWAVTLSFVPILAQQLGANDVWKGLLISLNIGAVTLGSLVNTLIAVKVRQRIKLYITTGLLVAGILVSARAPSLGLLFVGTFCMGMSNGFAYPTLLGLSIRRVQQNQRSTAMGIHQAIYAVGMFCGPWLGGILADRMGIRVMFLLVAVISGAVVSALLLLMRSTD